MKTWKEVRMVPDIGSAHVLDGHVDLCSSCTKLDNINDEDADDICEHCDVSVPITCDIHPQVVTMTTMTICGIPVGEPYQVKEN